MRCASRLSRRRKRATRPRPSACPDSQSQHLHGKAHTPCVCFFLLLRIDPDTTDQALWFEEKESKRAVKQVRRSKSLEIKEREEGKLRERNPPVNTFRTFQ